MKCLEASSWCLMKLLMKKLEILKKNIKFRGGFLGLKVFLMLFEVVAALIVEVTAVKVRVTAAKHKLVLLVILMKNMLITTAGRVYSDREEIKDLSEKG
ncbi:hypothetical protein Tco_0778269 [Tanacetum coccineum]